MKILFAVPKIKSLFGGKGLTTHPHVGVAYLASFLRQKGVEVRIFDDGIEEDTAGLPGTIARFRPDLVGITMFSYCFRYARELVDMVKKECAVPVVVGGPHVSTARERILSDTSADFAVKHEGEYALLELLQGISGGRSDFSGISGLIWRKGREITENPDRPLNKELDALPFPDYDVFGIERYDCYKHRTLPLITSRGCPFGCNYCSVALSMGRGFRARSAQNVVDEIEFFVRKGWTGFDINDDCFTLDQERAGKICDLVIERGLKIRFQLFNGIRADAVTPALLGKMKQAGCFFISYGCEAGTDKVLEQIKKGIKLEQVRKAVVWANEAGISNAVNFIIGHTAETYADALQTLAFARSLPTDFVNFYNLLPYPGTESYEWVRQNGRFLSKPEFYLENISYRDEQPVFETDEFTRSQRIRVMRKGFALYKKKILTLRLGKALGTLVYALTRLPFLDKLATEFALSNRFGKRIFMSLAKFFRKE